MDPNELIKAAPAIAKGAAALGAALPLTEIIKRIIGPAADELGEMWANRIRVYRRERQSELLEKIKRTLEEDGLTAQSVPIKLLLPLIETPSSETDSNLHGQWAALLENRSPQTGRSRAQSPLTEGALDKTEVLPSEEPGLLVEFIGFSPELLRYLQEDSQRLRLLTPEQFEHLVADRLDRMGYNVMLTGRTNSRDGGIDLIAVPKRSDPGSVIIAAQVKHHREKARTGREAVDRLLAWKDSVFGVGLLVTNTEFTRDAIWTAQRESNRHFVRLRDSADLKRWLGGQFGDQQDWRELPDSIEVAPGIVIQIPKPLSDRNPDLRHGMPKPKE
jgi:hypothetical protein